VTGRWKYGVTSAVHGRCHLVRYLPGSSLYDLRAMPYAQSVTLSGWSCSGRDRHASARLLSWILGH
jgi:hypothetical protein